MSVRDRKAQAPKLGRRLLVGVGAGAGVFLAAAAMATGSAVTAAPAHADFEDLLDPIIQPLLTSFTDAVSAVDPAAALDITSWTDSLLASLGNFDLALPSTDSALAAAASSAEPAAVATSATYDLPITLMEGTEPTVQASVDGGTSLPVLVDTGSSGLVVPLTDITGSSNLLTEWDTLLSLGAPSSFGESGYSGGVDYIYLTYNDLPVSYADGLTTNGPVEVEVYSWNPSDFGSLFTNDAFQNFLAGNDSQGGILGIGDNVNGGAGVSPFDSYGSALVDLKNDQLIIGGSNPYQSLDSVANNGSTLTGLTETVTNSSGGSVGSATGISDDLDTGGVQGTIPSTISGVTAGDTITVKDGATVLYSYTVPSGGVPLSTSGTSIDSGYYALVDHPLYIDYANDTTYIDSLTSAT
ncbi:hypothetical protein [Mycobacterium paraterrae]|uniref:PE cleavage protein A C-terminal domain-containing protein n=1 Tax=Mycobacterium paraterrae TaxID=577492 RepID=A0ABY3VLS6_9MYCO|nr:hypothetical protein [Mycobacterium paraterrae]UMB67623.1 hypothetical protein MKK62_13975 [Mycobacterium paraterrae]